MQTQNKNYISLSALASRVNIAVQNALPGQEWVVAEISECKVNTSSGHCYMNLVERPAAGGAPLAEFRAAIWAKQYNMIASYFLQSTGMTLEAGMKVLLCVAVNYHPVYGLSLLVSDIDPTYTVGEGERERRATIARLEKENLMDMQREFALPLVALRFAVVSSATAAGYEDFMKQIQASPYDINCQLFVAAMQGEQTERSVIAALEKISKRAAEFDAVIIIRGGGSASDLRWFDSYALAAAIARFELPVMTGIGHEKDTSVADLVAFHSFKTPTAVAAGLVERVAMINARLERMMEATIGVAQNVFLGESARLNKVATTLSQLTIDKLHMARLKLEKLTADTTLGASTVVARQVNALQQVEGRVQSVVSVAIEKARSMLELLAWKVENRNPRSILKMGYSIVKSDDGRAIKSVSQAQSGAILNIELTDGTIKTKVE